MRALPILLAMTGLAGAAPTDLVGRPLVLGEGDVAATVTSELATDTFALAPDAWLGLTPRTTIGIISSNASIDRIGAGSTAAGLDARWSWRDGAVAIAPRARFLLRDADREPAATFGALVRWTRGRFALRSDPYVRVALADRATNRDAIVVPIWLEAQPTARWLVAIHTGFGGDPSTMMTAWHVPFALDTCVRVAARLDIVVEAGFTSLLAPGGTTSPSIAIALARNRV